MAEKIQPGQTLPGIPARSWNEFVDTANRVRQMPLRTAPAGKSSGGPATVATILNTGDATVDVGYPIVYSQPHHWPDDEDETPAFYAPELTGSAPYSSIGFGATPTVTKDSRWGVTLAPIKEDEAGPLVIHGLTWAWVDVKNNDHTTCGLNLDPDELDEYEDPAALISGGSGATIVWKRLGGDEYQGEDTGLQRCLIFVGDSTLSTNLAGAQLAVVTQQAGAAGYEGETDDSSFKLVPSASGMAVLLVPELNEYDDIEWVMASQEEYDSVEDFEFPVVSVHDVPLLVGKVIRAYNVPILQPTRTITEEEEYEGSAGGGFGGGGLVDPQAPVSDEYGTPTTPAFGEYVNAGDYLKALSTYTDAAAQILYHNEAGEYEDDADLLWGGAECAGGS